MSNTTNPKVYFPSLLQLAADKVFNKDFQLDSKIIQAYPSEIHTREQTDVVLQYVWDNFKVKLYEYGLCHFAFDIENSQLKKMKLNIATLAQEKRETHLAGCVNALFKAFNKKFSEHVTKVSSSYSALCKPIDPVLCIEVVQAAVDESLMKMWNKLLPQFHFGDQDKKPSNVDEVRAWIKSPDNSNKINAIQFLRLSFLNLKLVPPEIGYFVNLKSLNLDTNQLSALPDAIGKLINLQELHLDSNQLSALPDAIGKLINLQELYLDSNQLSALPDAIGKLVNLQKLYLDGNQLSALPDAIGKLINLQELYLDSNQLSALPDAIGKLINLQGLYLNSNQLSALPDAIGKLVNLHWLYLASNQLSALPDAIGKLINLQGLYLDDNPLLFILNEDSKTAMLQKHSDFKNYTCLSPFSRFYQLMDKHFYGDFEIIKEAFKQLEEQDKNLIFEMVYLESHCVPDDFKWEECHVFDDKGIFCRAVRKAVAVKFERLPQNQKNQIYGALEVPVNPKTEDAQWGEHHAFDHVLRLIDAMYGVL